LLEIGVGSVPRAAYRATSEILCSAIDLTDYAAAVTRRRLELNGIVGSVLQMDAERMEFPDQSFDLIWTWV